MIYENSRYARGYLLKDKKDEGYYLAPQPMQYETKSTDLIYQFEAGDRLDLVSKKFYGNPNYKWIILQANPQYMSELEIKKGDILVIPNPQEVEAYVNATS